MNKAMMAVILMAVAGTGHAGGFGLEGMDGGAIRKLGVAAVAPEPVIEKVVERGAGVRLYVSAPAGLEAAAGAIFMARKDSFFCTTLSMNEGSVVRVPKRIYPSFGAKNGAITIPDAIDSRCDYGRVDEGTLSFSLPGQAEPYNAVTLLPGGNGAEQVVTCGVIKVSEPGGGAKEMVRCVGDIKLDASKQARVRVTLERGGETKSLAAGAASAALAADRMGYVPMTCTVNGRKVLLGNISEAAAELELNSPLFSPYANGAWGRFTAFKNGDTLIYRSFDNPPLRVQFSAPAGAIAGSKTFESTLIVNYPDAITTALPMVCSLR